MSDNFKSNFGTLLKIGSGSTAPYTYTPIKGVFIVPPIETEQEKIEVTHHDQNSPYRKYIPSGLIDPGDYQFQMRSDRADSTQQALYTAFKAGSICHFQIAYPDGLAQEFDAYVTGMTYNEADATSPEPVNITVTLAISGDVTDSIDSL